MPTVDTADMDSGFEGTQYADFRHQTVNVSTQEETGNSNVTSLNRIEPLEEVGGLEPNQVAELVMIEVDFGVEYEGSTGHVEFRGEIGSGHSSEDDTTAESNGNGTILSTNGTAQTGTRGRVGSEYFITFRNHFENAKSTDSRRYHFRHNYGRGPVLDDQDTIDVISRIINGTGGVVSGMIRMKLVWDIAETDDAGRRFSVPN